MMPNHAKFEAPWEYVELLLCRDVYHCLPSQLQDEDWVDIQNTITMINTEAEVRKLKGK